MEMQMHPRRVGLPMSGDVPDESGHSIPGYPPWGEDKLSLPVEPLFSARGEGESSNSV